MAENLQELTLAQLKELARARIGRGHSLLRTKAQLIDALSKASSQTGEAAEAVSPSVKAASKKAVGRAAKAGSGKVKAAKAKTSTKPAATGEIPSKKAVRKKVSGAKSSTRDDVLSTAQISLLDAFSAALDGLSKSIAAGKKAAAASASVTGADLTVERKRKTSRGTSTPARAKAATAKLPPADASPAKKRAKKSASTVDATDVPASSAATAAEAPAPYSAGRRNKGKASTKKTAGEPSAQAHVPAPVRGGGILDALPPHAVTTSPHEGGRDPDAAASDPFPVESTPEGAAVPLRLEDEALGELPDSYDEERMSLVSKGPYSLYLYWDFSKDTLSKLVRTEGVVMCLRLYADGRMVRELECTVKDRSWYFKGLQPGLTYQVELMVMDGQGNATRIGVPSNQVVLPEVGPSKTIDDRFGSVTLGSDSARGPAHAADFLTVTDLHPMPFGSAAPSRFSEALRDALFKASGGEIPSSIRSSDQFAFGSSEHPGQNLDGATSPAGAWGAILPDDSGDKR